jgi:hypothetical protein
MKNTVRAGQFYAAKYAGDNGDLILGRVNSMRKTGHVILENLLTGNTSTKNISVLLKRNSKISKKDSDLILKVWRSTRRKSDTRKRAVEITSKKSNNNPKVVVIGTSNRKGLQSISVGLRTLIIQLEDLSRRLESLVITK